MSARAAQEDIDPEKPFPDILVYQADQADL